MRIEKKHLVTGALLAFVVATGVTLAVKETAHTRAVAEAESARPAVASAAPAPDAVAAPADPLPPAEPTTALAETAPLSAPPAAPPVTAPARPGRPAAPIAARPEAPKPAAPDVVAPAPAEPPATVYVTYFHTTARCTSCIKIENLTEMTMTTRLAGPVAEKRVVFRSVNIDEPANVHFVKDYSLYTKSVVVSEVKDGREIRWKNLDQVWQLLGNPESFQSYVEREVQAFLEKA
ncbi:MAG: nitrophenyl compound nitroreductase subunit ArsF family protein [Thermoanaerobaculia bacterium]